MPLDAALLLISLLPKNKAGLHQPLRCPKNANLAALLCRKTPTQLATESKSVSMIMSSHVAKAVFLYKKIVNAHPCPDVHSANAYKLLHELDPLPAQALIKKFDPSNPERRLGKDQAGYVANLVISNTQALPLNLPADVRNHCFNLVHNSLPTHDRMKYVVMSLAQDDAAPRKCSFCASADETLAHIHTLCPASRTAMNTIKVKLSQEQKRRSSSQLNPMILFFAQH